MTTEQKAAELLPCPMCGNKANLVQQSDTVNPNCTWIECSDCAVMTDSCYADTKADAAAFAVKIWNTRTNPAPVADAVEALEKAISDAFADNGPFVDMPKTIIAFLQKQRWHIRRETMTEAELERDARKLCTVQNVYWDNSQPTTHYMTEEAAMQLAKKYRG